MEYLEQILNLMIWPITIYASYYLIVKTLNKVK